MAGIRALVKRICSRLAVPVYRFAVRESLVLDHQQVLQQLRTTSQDLEICYPWDIRGAQHVSVGKDVFIGPGVLMIAEPGGEIRFGNKIMLGPRVRLMASNHRYDQADRPIREQGYANMAPIIMEDDVWIGAGATILRGVKIGRGTIVGAGAVLTKSTGEYEIWAGNPARKVKHRFSAVAQAAAESSSQ